MSEGEFFVALLIIYDQRHAAPVKHWTREEVMAVLREAGERRGEIAPRARRILRRDAARRRSRLN